MGSEEFGSGSILLLFVFYQVELSPPAGPDNVIKIKEIDSSFKGSVYSSVNVLVVCQKLSNL